MSDETGSDTDKHDMLPCPVCVDSPGLSDGTTVVRNGCWACKGTLKTSAAFVAEYIASVRPTTPDGER